MASSLSSYRGAKVRPHVAVCVGYGGRDDYDRGYGGRGYDRDYDDRDRYLSRRGWDDGMTRHAHIHHLKLCLTIYYDGHILGSLN